MIGVLAIAGSDPSGGAGAQADIKTFAALRCYGMAAITALTVQNTRGVLAVHPIAPEIVAAQIEAVFADIAVDAVKVGMLATAENAEAAASALARVKARNIVVDPVLAASQGVRVSGAGLAGTILRRLAPLADLVTPNLAEASALTGLPLAGSVEEAAAQARALVAAGAKAALVKGGHLRGAPIDALFDGGEITLFPGRRIDTPNTHGTGCALSSAIAAHLAQGAPLAAAVRMAKDWLEGALAAGAAERLGAGAGPPQHFWQAWESPRLRPIQSDRKRP